MLKTVGTIASLAAAGALLAAPATGLAAKGGQGKEKSCAKTPTVGYQVGGTLVAATEDDPSTPESEATVTLTVKSANSHARRSGEIADQDPGREGVQVKGATYAMPAGDAFALRVNGYVGTDTPSPGDRVKVNGRIARTKKRCAADGSATDRYGSPDVRRVTIADRDQGE